MHDKESDFIFEFSESLIVISVFTDILGTFEGFTYLILEVSVDLEVLIFSFNI